MMIRLQNTIKSFFILLALCGLSGCSQNMQIIPHHSRSYVVTPNTSDQGSPMVQEVKKKDKERTYATILFHKKGTPDSDTTVVELKRKYRAYMLEAPMGKAIPIGEHKLQPMFDIGYHRDHKAFAGFVLRMEF